MTYSDGIALIEAERDSMLSVSTGGPRIQELNPAYLIRRKQVAAFLREHGLEDPNRYSDLWAWYGKWSNGDLPTYQSRREFLRELFAPTLQALAQRSAGHAASPVAQPTGWLRVDRDIDTYRLRLEQARAELEFQQVGLCCREALISLGQAVFDPQKHAPSDGVKPSDTDAFRLIEAFFTAELGGSSNETVRAHAKSAVRLANELVHRRTADRRAALLCAEATRTVINLAAIVAGRHF
jgi:hypothetical protein